MRIKLHDVVALTEAMPAHGLSKGQVGTVVENLSPDAFEVEFADDEGQTYASVGIPTAKLLLLRYRPGLAA